MIVTVTPANFPGAVLHLEESFVEALCKESPKASRWEAVLWYAQLTFDQSVPMFIIREIDRDFTRTFIGANNHIVQVREVIGA